MKAAPRQSHNRSVDAGVEKTRRYHAHDLTDKNIQPVNLSTSPPGGVEEVHETLVDLLLLTLIKAESS